MSKQIEVTFFEDIAEEVKAIHEAMQTINKSKLTETAIIALLQRSTREPVSSIKNVLYGLKTIDKFLKK